MSLIFDFYFKHYFEVIHNLLPSFERQTNNTTSVHTAKTGSVIFTISDFDCLHNTRCYAQKYTPSAYPCMNLHQEVAIDGVNLCGSNTVCKYLEFGAIYFHISISCFFLNKPLTKYKNNALTCPHDM
jgi:hypothetical protein